MTVEIVVLIMTLSATFPLVGYYLDWRFKNQHRFKKNKPKADATANPPS